MSAMDWCETEPGIVQITMQDRAHKNTFAALPAAVQREIAMHETTFHRPEVKDRIQALLGK